MHKLALHIAGLALCAAVFAGSGLFLDVSTAGPLKSQPQPQPVVGPCAVRPHCAGALCTRSGKCGFGAHNHMSGCLLYVCRGARR